MNKTLTDIKPKLGFIGVGWIGRNRMEAVADSQFAEITSIYDLDDNLCEELHGQMKALQRSASIEDMMDSELEGVVIATPSAMHASQAIAALDKGKAVFCQKPLGRNARETAQVVEAAEENDLLLGLDLSYRYTEAAQKLREVIQSGELGEIFHMELVFHNAYGPDKSWYYDKKLSGGGCVVDLGIHLVDLALWLSDFPEVSNVSSQLFSKGQPLEDGQIEDFATAQFRMGNTAVQLACSWNLSAGQDAVIGLNVYGTQGGVSFQNVNGSFYDFEVTRFNGTAREQLCTPPDNWGGRAAVAWAKQLAEGKRFDKSAYEYIETAKVLDEIYKNNTVK
jgi:predicted dehydrogenase